MNSDSNKIYDKISKELLKDKNTLKSPKKTNDKIEEIKIKLEKRGLNFDDYRDFILDIIENETNKKYEEKILNLQKTENIKTKFLFENIKNSIKDFTFSDYIFYYKKLILKEDLEDFNQEFDSFLKNFSNYIISENKKFEKSQIENILGNLQASDYSHIKDKKYFIDAIVKLLSDEKNEKIDNTKLMKLFIDISDFSPNSINENFKNNIIDTIIASKGDFGINTFSNFYNSILKNENKVLGKNFFDKINILFDSIEDKVFLKKLIIEFFNNINSNYGKNEEKLLINLLNKLKKFPQNYFDKTEIKKLFFSIPNEIIKDQESFDWIFNILKDKNIGEKEFNSILDFVIKMPEIAIKNEYFEIMRNLIIKNPQNFSKDYIEHILIDSRFIFDKQSIQKINEIYFEKKEEIEDKKEEKENMISKIKGFFTKRRF